MIKTIKFSVKPRFFQGFAIFLAVIFGDNKLTRWLMMKSFKATIIILPAEGIGGA